MTQETKQIVLTCLRMRLAKVVKSRHGWSANNQIWGNFTAIIDETEKAIAEVDGL